MSQYTYDIEIEIFEINQRLDRLELSSDDCYGKVAGELLAKRYACIAAMLTRNPKFVKSAEKWIGLTNELLITTIKIAERKAAEKERRRITEHLDRVRAADSDRLDEWLNRIKDPLS